MLERLRKLSDRANRVTIAVCVACVLVMLSISFIGFFYMIVTGAALSWTYSLARLFIPWIGMLSITVAFKGGEHVAVNMVVRLLPGRFSRLLRSASLFLVALFALLLVWFGWHFFLASNQIYMVSDQLQVHARWIAACVPVSGLILLLHLASGFALLGPVEAPREAAPSSGER
ncbi:MAG TPA: TRAP transporter small permease subunit [Burkholderiales bacterium]|nr:TRAP transporter small permease subunit [Burkholderiales bacterium]